MLRFSIQSSKVPGERLAKKFELLAHWGYDGIEISGEELLAQTDELRRLTREYPVRISTALGGHEGWLVDPNPRARHVAIAQIKKLLAALVEFDASGLIEPAAYGINTRGALPPWRQAYTLEEERARLVDSLAQIAESAEQTGGTLLLEPLNRYEERVLNTLADGVSVIEEVRSPSVKLMPDFFHMNIEEADIPTSLRESAPYIGHLHLADSNRRLPGEGHTDFTAGFAVLNEVGYDGFLSLECRVTGDPMESLPRTLAFLRRAAGR